MDDSTRIILVLASTLGAATFGAVVGYFLGRVLPDLDRDSAKSHPRAQRV